MPRKTKKYPKSINVMLTDQQDTQARQVAEAQGLDVGPWVRQAIMGAWEMQFANTPRCANRESCKCPQMHSVTSPVSPLPPGE